MTDIKLLIFDMDGTLIDSAYLNYYSYSNAFRTFNIELDEEYYYEKCFGLHYKTFVSNILDLNKITKDKVDLAHLNGAKVNVWTVNSRNDINRFIDMGVDMITSDLGF